MFCQSRITAAFKWVTPYFDLMYCFITVINNLFNRFRDHDSAMEFYFSYNGTPFSSLEPDILCRIVWVSRVEWAHDGLAPPGHTELPMCPVCLGKKDIILSNFYRIFI